LIQNGKTRQDNAWGVQVSHIQCPRGGNGDRRAGNRGEGGKQESRGRWNSWCDVNWLICV